MSLFALTFAIASFAAQSCDKDPALATAKADCQFGNQNFYFQISCMEIYRYSAIAANVDTGSRAALDDLKNKVDAAKAQPAGDQTTAYARARGMAKAGISTANFGLSATQLVLAELLSARKNAKEKLTELAARNQSDAAVLAYLQQGTGARNTAGSLRLRQTQLDDYSRRVAGQTKAKSKLEQGIQASVDAEKRLRTLRSDLAKFKKGSTDDLAKLPSPKDKSEAASEDARTKKLSKDDPGIFDKIKANCFQDNGLRLGCSRALEALDLYTTMGALGAVKTAVRKIAWESFKGALKSYFGDDSLKQMLLCGQGKGIAVFDLYRDEDLGAAAVPPTF